MKPVRWAVMISGRGSNLAALLESREQMLVPLVISSRANAPGLARARRAGGIHVHVMKKGAEGWREVEELLSQYRIDAIFLAGFMKIVPGDFVSRWENKIFNVHPSLLPMYPGLKSIERAFEEGAAMGITVHRVTAGVDEGPILLQRQVLPNPRGRDYSLEEAEILMHITEHRLVREVVKQWSCRKTYS